MNRTLQNGEKELTSQETDSQAEGGGLVDSFLLRGVACRGVSSGRGERSLTTGDWIRTTSVPEELEEMSVAMLSPFTKLSADALARTDSVSTEFASTAAPVSAAWRTCAAMSALRL